MERCLSCQAFLAADEQHPDGYYCPNCYDKWTDADLEMNGWEWSEPRQEWVKSGGGGQ